MAASEAAKQALIAARDRVEAGADQTEVAAQLMASRPFGGAQEAYLVAMGEFICAALAGATLDPEHL